jgi:hypothetical protein
MAGCRLKFFSLSLFPHFSPFPSNWSQFNYFLFNLHSLSIIILLLIISPFFSFFPSKSHLNPNIFIIILFHLFLLLFFPNFQFFTYITLPHTLNNISKYYFHLIPLTPSSYLFFIFYLISLFFYFLFFSLFFLTLFTLHNIHYILTLIINYIFTFRFFHYIQLSSKSINFFYFFL